ncbi:MAG: alpha/beta hydrolase [Firmicutes bacterium]|nr:alpha/beta hydrolase [Bacillota bacterium]
MLTNLLTKTRKQLAFILTLVLSVCQIHAVVLVNADEDPYTPLIGAEHGNYDEEEIIYYISDKDGEQYGIRVYKPGDWTPDRKYPTMFWYHGGGWRNGSSRPGKIEFARYAAANGMLAFVPTYYTEQTDSPLTADIAASTRDSIKAYEFVLSKADEYGIDKTRIAACGGSAGGHLALMLTRQGSLDNPAINIVMNPAVNSMLNTMAPDYSPYLTLFGGYGPSVIFHGTADNTVPHADAAAYYDKAVDMGLDFTLKSFQGRGHGFWSDEPDWSYIKSYSEYFFVKHGFLRRADGLENNEPPFEDSVCGIDGCTGISFYEEAFGEQDDDGSYTISNSKQLNHIRKHLDGNLKFRLQNNTVIDLSEAPFNGEEGFPSIGKGYFKGVFDGNRQNGAKIINYNMLTADSKVGLFSQIAFDSVVKNLDLTVGNLKTTSADTNSVIGGIAGVNEGRIENCKVTITGSIEANKETAGGLVARNATDAVIDNCEVILQKDAGIIAGGNRAGGLAGNTNVNSTISNCIVTVGGKILASDNAAGLAGVLAKDTVTQNCAVLIMPTAVFSSPAGLIAGTVNASAATSGVLVLKPIDYSLVTAKANSGTVNGGFINYTVSGAGTIGLIQPTVEGFVPISITPIGLETVETVMLGGADKGKPSVLALPVDCTDALEIMFSGGAVDESSDGPAIFEDNFTEGSGTATIETGHTPLQIKYGDKNVYQFVGPSNDNGTYAYGTSGLTMSSALSNGNGTHVYNVIALEKPIVSSKSSSNVTETKFQFNAGGGAAPQKKVDIFARFGNSHKTSYYFQMQWNASTLNLYSVDNEKSAAPATAAATLTESLQSDALYTAKTVVIDKPNGDVYTALYLYNSAGTLIGSLTHTFEANDNPLSAANAVYGPGFGIANGNVSVLFKSFAVKDILGVKIKGAYIPNFRGSKYDYNIPVSGAHSIGESDIVAEGFIPEATEPQVDYNEATAKATITYNGLIYTIDLADAPGRTDVSIDDITMTVDNIETTIISKGDIKATANISNNTTADITKALAVVALYDGNNILIACKYEPISYTIAAGTTGNMIPVEIGNNKMPDIDYTDARLRFFLWDSIDNLIPVAISMGLTN